jgi:hypothetical protein
LKDKRLTGIYIIAVARGLENFDYRSSKLSDEFFVAGLTPDE